MTNHSLPLTLIRSYTVLSFFLSFCSNDKNLNFALKEIQTALDSISYQLVDNLSQTNWKLDEKDSRQLELFLEE